VTTIQDMYAAVDAAAQDHFEWCTEHDYVNEADPRVQLCRSKFELDFPKADGYGDDVSALSVELAGSHADIEHGVPVPLASIGFNGRFGERDFEAWKLAPIAYLLLATQARAEGDHVRARAFMDAAQTAITEHLTAAEDNEPDYVVSEPAKHWSQGPFNYVMVSRPDDEIITYDQYEVEQALAAGIPQWVIQHAQDGRRYRVVGALDDKPVDDETYGEFAEAKPVRDRLNEQARRDAAAAANRAALVLDAAKRVFDAAPVPHHFDRTQPHPRAVKDCARNVHGIEATDAEIQAAVKVVMA
jgi:hypothetical protein